jgi:hypothetical protein
MAYRVRDWCIPVRPTPKDVFVGTEEIPLSPPRIESFIVEEWSDATIRHPTTGVIVTKQLWVQHRIEAEYILRTAGR